MSHDRHWTCLDFQGLRIVSSMFLCMSPQSKVSCDTQQSKLIGLQLESVEAEALVSFYLQSASSMPVADIGRDTSVSI